MYSRVTSQWKILKIGSNKGFTLIEVLIAISILATLAVIIQSSWSGNLIRYKSSQIKTQAVELLQKKIIEIETEYKGRIDALPEELQSGEFEEEEYKKYKWEWKSQKLELPDISALVSTDGEDTMIVTVLESFRKYLNDSIKEVQVVVTYQNGKERPYKFTVPFYMVNYDNQMTLGITGSNGQSIESLQNQGQGGGGLPVGGGSQPVGR